MQYSNMMQALIDSVLKLQQEQGLSDEATLEHFKNMVFELGAADTFEEWDLGTAEDEDELMAVGNEHGFDSEEYWRKFNEQTDKRAREALGM